MSKRQAADAHNYERWLSTNAHPVEPEKPVNKKALHRAATVLAMGASFCLRPMGSIRRGY